MAQHIYKPDEENQKKFIIDDDADTTDLPTSSDFGANGEGKVAFGSVAFSINSSKIYVLDSTDNWVEVSNVSLFL